MNLNTVDNLRFGSNQVSRAFLGSDLVWEAGSNLDPSLNAAWVFYAESGDTLDIALSANQQTDVEFYVNGFGLESSYQVGSTESTISHTFQNTGLSYFKFSNDSIKTWNCVKSNQAFGGTVYLSKIPNVEFFQHRAHFTKIIEHTSLQAIYQYRDYINLQDVNRPEISSWDSHVFNISDNLYTGQPHTVLGVGSTMYRYVVYNNNLSGEMGSINDQSFNNLQYYWLFNNSLSGKIPDVFDVGKTNTARDVQIKLQNNSFSGVSAKFGFNENIKKFEARYNSIDRKGLDKILRAANGLYSDIDDVTVDHGGDRLTMKFTDILYANNTNDPATGLGGVAYDYSISKYEVTADQFDKALSSDPNIDDTGLYGSGGTIMFPERPVNNISFNEAAKYANWLTTGNALEGAYQFSDLNTLVTINREFALQQYEIVYVIPNHDEWYKAAYFTPSAWSEYTTMLDTGGIYLNADDYTVYNDVLYVAVTSHNTNDFDDDLDDGRLSLVSVNYVSSNPTGNNLYPQGIYSWFQDGRRWWALKLSPSGYPGWTSLGEVPWVGKDPPEPGVDVNYLNGTQAWDVGSGKVENNGTYDMAGNEYEWLEESVARGGAHYTTEDSIKNTGGTINVASGGQTNVSFRVAALSLKYDNRTGQANPNPVSGSLIDLRNNDPLGPTSGPNNQDYLDLVNKGWTVNI